MTQIVNDFPPNIDAIRGTFPLTGHEIFAWKGTIYNPGGGTLTAWLIEHEKVHFRQQDGKPEAWWARYLVDEQFRLDQELEAHRVEYRSFCSYVKDRNQRARYLMEISGRLASPMYGGIISRAEAAKRIRS